MIRASNLHLGVNIVRQTKTLGPLSISVFLHGHHFPIVLGLFPSLMKRAFSSEGAGQELDMWEEYGSSWVFCQLKLTSKSISSLTHLRQASLESSASCVQLGELDCKSIPLTAAAWKHTDETHCIQTISRSHNYRKTQWASCNKRYLNISSQQNIIASLWLWMNRASVNSTENAEWLLAAKSHSWFIVGYPLVTHRMCLTPSEIGK